MTALDRLYVAQSVDLAAARLGVTDPLCIASVAGEVQRRAARDHRGHVTIDYPRGQSLQTFFNRIRRRHDVGRCGGHSEIGVRAERG